MKNNTNSQLSIRPGKYVELSKDINCIPSGVYYLADKDDYNLYFAIGKSVMFSLSSDCKEFLRPVPSQRAVIKKTSLKSFLDRYYQHYFKVQGEPAFWTNGPKTMCCIDPAVAYEMN